MPTTPVAAAAGTFTIGDMTVNRLGYGAMRITGPGIWGPPRDKSEALRVLRTAIDIGINFIDTADSYGPDVSEELIAEALHPYPDGLVIATKGGFERYGPDKWKINARPEHLEQALKGSLKRLKLDRVDLYQLHRFDPRVPMDETLDKLRDLQQQGLIRHLGLSEVDVEQCRKTSERIGFVSVQNKYNLTERQWEPVLEWCRERDIAFLPWYPLAAGSLENDTLRQVAERHDATPYQIAIAWLLRRATNIVPIPGTSSVPHLRENTAAAEIALSDEDLKALERLSKNL